MFIIDFSIYLSIYLLTYIFIDEFIYEFRNLGVHLCLSQTLLKTLGHWAETLPFLGFTPTGPTKPLT